MISIFRASNLVTISSRAPAAAMERVVLEIETRYGDVAAYLRAAGLHDAQIDRLRNRLAPA